MGMGVNLRGHRRLLVAAVLVDVLCLLVFALAASAGNTLAAGAAVVVMILSWMAVTAYIALRDGGLSRLRQEASPPTPAPDAEEESHRA